VIPHFWRNDNQINQTFIHPHNSLSLSLSLSIYIYIERERERESAQNESQIYEFGDSFIFFPSLLLATENLQIQFFSEYLFFLFLAKSSQRIFK
jgi:hypothetical protein